VCCLVPGGSYSEYCSAKWGTCLPIPFKGTDSDRFVKSAGIPENAFTVWRNVFRDYDLDHLSSQNVSMLFHGGSSGIGSTAIAMAKAFGVSKVIVTAGSEEKCDACLRFGADVAINYNDESEDGKLDWTTKAGKVDFILDMVGGEYLNQNLKILNTNGKLAIIGFLQSPMSTVNMTRVMLKSLHITGSVLRSQPQRYARTQTTRFSKHDRFILTHFMHSFKELLALEIQDHVWPLVESGALQLPANISHVYRGIESVDDALSVMQSSSHIGKIVVEV